MKRASKKFRLKEHVSKKGFTVIEALVTTILFATLFGACLTLLISGSTSWHINSTQIEILQELNKTRDWMTNDLRQAGSGVITNVPANGTWYATITFRRSSGVTGGNITWGPTIQYSLSSNQILRSSSGVSSIIAHDIQTLQIRRQAATPNIVEVSLQGQKMAASRHIIAANLIFELKLRN